MPTPRDLHPANGDDAILRLDDEWGQELTDAQRETVRRFIARFHKGDDQ